MLGKLTWQAIPFDDPVGLVAGGVAFGALHGFSDMRFKVEALAEREFEAWVRGVQSDGPVLDRAAYIELARQSRNAPTTT